MSVITVIVIISVAPHVGAWIETVLCVCAPEALRSLPTWERGLKQAGFLFPSVSDRSLPTWERGLKHPFREQKGSPMWVAPHVGAWIETVSLSRLQKR